MYEYKVDRVIKIIDGDTIDLSINLGFSISKWHKIASLIFFCKSSMVSPSVKMETPNPLAVYPPSALSSTKKIISSMV